MSLATRGSLPKALDYLRRGHELGSKDPRWAYPSGQWVKNCERLVQLDAKFAGSSRARSSRPTSVSAALAQICQLPCKSLYAAAARFYAEAFAAKTTLADDLQGQHRYNAASPPPWLVAGPGKTQPS